MFGQVQLRQQSEGADGDEREEHFVDWEEEER
jgi:hypothetical protein